MAALPVGPWSACADSEHLNMVSPEQVLEALRQVMDPDLRRDIVSLGFVKNLEIRDDVVSFVLLLTTPACPVKDKMKAEAEGAVRRLPGVRRVEVELKADVRPMLPPTGLPLLPGRRNVVPVGSGKGGVGKSTVAANVA